MCESRNRLAFLALSARITIWVLLPRESIPVPRHGAKGNPSMRSESTSRRASTRQPLAGTTQRFLHLEATTHHCSPRMWMLSSMMMFAVFDVSLFLLPSHRPSAVQAQRLAGASACCRGAAHLTDQVGDSCRLRTAVGPQQNFGGCRIDDLVSDVPAAHEDSSRVYFHACHLLPPGFSC